MKHSKRLLIRDYKNGFEDFEVCIHQLNQCKSALIKCIEKSFKTPKRTIKEIHPNNLNIKKFIYNSKYPTALSKLNLVHTIVNKFNMFCFASNQAKYLLQENIIVDSQYILSRRYCSTKICSEYNVQDFFKGFNGVIK